MESLRRVSVRSDRMGRPDLYSMRSFPFPPSVQTDFVTVGPTMIVSSPSNASIMIAWKFPSGGSKPDSPRDPTKPSVANCPSVIPSDVRAAKFVVTTSVEDVGPDASVRVKAIRPLLSRAVSRFPRPAFPIDVFNNPINVIGVMF